jgi:two-component system nitrogen regulation response regulator GlnG/two-component system response regulator HydG
MSVAPARSKDETAETADGPPRRSAAHTAGASLLALAIVWSAEEPERVGEVLLVPPGRTVHFGRASDSPEPDAARPVRQRPGVNLEMPFLRDKFLSRRQLAMKSDGETIAVTRTGKRAVLAFGRTVDEVRVREGDLVEVEDVLLLSCVRRPEALPMMRHGAVEASHAFGEADAHGIVGESPAVWRLREDIAWVASKRSHVLVTGATGTGKELVARAIHDASPRRAKKLVARNATTFPPGLVDAELFGNLAGYPHAGMPERPGVVGEAEGGTLFLDEVGELPVELQTHLLRLLDDDAEYHRLGDARRRVADVRVIAATNRPLGDLKTDLVARFPLRVETPTLDARREDVPLVVRALVHRAEREDASVARFFRTRGRARIPDFSCELMRELAARVHPGHVRDLNLLVWRAIEESADAALELTSGVRRALGAPMPSRASSEITADEIRAALARAGGVQAKAFGDLGLPNRFALRRLMKAHGINGDET